MEVITCIFLLYDLQIFEKNDFYGSVLSLTIVPDIIFTEKKKRKIIFFPLIVTDYKYC